MLYMKAATLLLASTTALVATVDAAAPPPTATGGSEEVAAAAAQPRILPILGTIASTILPIFAEKIIDCMFEGSCGSDVTDKVGPGDDSVPLAEVTPVQCTVDTDLPTFPFNYEWVNLRSKPCDNTPVLSKLVTGDTVMVRFHPETRTKACGYKYQRVVYETPAGKQLVGWMNPGALRC